MWFFTNRIWLCLEIEYIPRIAIRCWENERTPILDLKSTDLHLNLKITVKFLAMWGLQVIAWGHYQIHPIAGWWYTYPFEEYEFVRWDYEIPNRWKHISVMFQTTIFFLSMFCSKARKTTNGYKCVSRDSHLLLQSSSKKVNIGEHEDSGHVPPLAPYPLVTKCSNENTHVQLGKGLPSRNQT